MLSGTTKLSFLLAPILGGVVLLLLVALLLGKLEGRRWPTRWW